MNKVIVTGGAGFIGSNLCDRLHKMGYYVICVDNLFTGRLKNIEHLIGKHNFEFVPPTVVMMGEGTFLS